MTFSDFIRERPCLDEIAGFKEQRMKDEMWSSQDQIDFLKYEDMLKRGKVMPTHTNDRQNWIYTNGRAAKRRPKPHA